MISRLCILIALFFLSACSSFLFVPIKPLPITPDGAELIYEDQFIETDDGLQLHGWKIFADTSKRDGKKIGNLLFFHGNGDNVSTQLPNTFWLAKEGYELYVYDYRGYGQSQGEPELDATILDMELMIKHSVEQLAEDEKLIVMGHSLGGSMATYVVAHSAYRSRIQALITVEAFSDYHDVTQDVLSKSWLFWLFQWPLSFTVSNAYSPVEAIGLVSPIPVCIIHSENDEMIPMYHADRLFAAAREPKVFKQIDSNHSNILLSRDNRQVLFDYLKTLRKK
ncbi:MAG: alpha/beta hydrolase [Proteobacteria bacterium]|nr:alpha/beta hydrolase [Pseudomonadota bacterium]